MSDRIKYLQKELAELVERHSDRDGSQPTEIPSLSFSRYSTPHHSAVTGPPYRPAQTAASVGLKIPVPGSSK